MNSKSVILVDDESYVTATIAARLRREGFTVANANDGQEGFELACKNPPDLIITDYQMPVLDGYLMSVQLKSDARTAQVPVLMLTSRGHHISEAQLVMTNILALFAKPFSARELVEKVKSILSASTPGATIQAA